MVARAHSRRLMCGTNVWARQARVSLPRRELLDQARAGAAHRVLRTWRARPRSKRGTSSRGPELVDALRVARDVDVRRGDNGRRIVTRLRSDRRTCRTHPCVAGRATVAGARDATGRPRRGCERDRCGAGAVARRCLQRARSARSPRCSRTCRSVRSSSRLRGDFPRAPIPRWWCTCARASSRDQP